MPPSNSVLSDIAVQQINSLGGPPLPLGVSMQTLKIIMENVAASQVPTSTLQVALALASRLM